MLRVELTLSRLAGHLGFSPPITRGAHPLSTWDLGWIHENLSITLHTL